jgi:hypothetical protein
MINILLSVTVTAVFKGTFMKLFVSSSEIGNDRKRK